MVSPRASERNASVYQQFLERIADLQRDRGRQCTAAEIVAFEISSGVPKRTAVHRLQRLREDGLIAFEGGERSRIVKLLPKGLERVAANRPKLRLLRPSRTTARYAIGCGPLQDAIAEAEYVTHPFRDFRESTDYLLEAEGESMFDPETGQGIRPGDQLLVRRDECPQTGEVVHADYVLENGVRETTLKVYDRFSGLVRLCPVNPAFPDIIRPESEIEIRGVVIEQVTPVPRFDVKSLTRK